jgi:hypothetical protein
MPSYEEVSQRAGSLRALTGLTQPAFLALLPLALEPHILIETTATWEGIAFQISEAFIMGFSFIGGTQEAHMTGLLDDEEVFDRMALLLAAVVVLLVLGIGWAVDRSLRSIMPKRGDVAPSCFRWLAKSVAYWPAVRVGSTSWCAKV